MSFYLWYAATTNGFFLLRITTAGVVVAAKAAAASLPVVAVAAGSTFAGVAHAVDSLRWEAVVIWVGTAVHGMPTRLVWDIHHEAMMKPRAVGGASDYYYRHYYSLSHLRVGRQTVG